MTESQRISEVHEDITFKALIKEIRTWIQYLLSKWKILFFAGLFGAILGLLIASFKKIEYTGTLTFALEDEKGGGGGLSGALGLASSLGIDLGTDAGGAFTGANLIELMKSRRIIERSLLNPVQLNGKSETLAEMYIQFNGWRENWIKNNLKLNQELYFPVNADRRNFSFRQDSLLGILYKNIMHSNLFVLQKDKKVSIITIDVKSSNELFSKLFAEAVAKEVSDFYIDTKSKKARANVEILQKQADSIRSELNEAITGVATANDITYNLNPALNVKRTPSLRRQVDVQANTAILTQLVTNLELAKVTLRKETPLIQVIDKPILPLEKDKPSRLLSAIIGAFLSGFLILVWIILKKLIS